MYSHMLMLLLLSAPSAEPVSLTFDGRPLLLEIEARLTSLDQQVHRREGRSAVPADKRFRYRFYSRSLVDGLQPPLPVGLPGTIPLLEHPDSRVRCGTLLMLERWLKETEYTDRISSSSVTQEDRRRLRLAILGCIADPTLGDNSLETGEFALRIFPGLAESSLTDAEQDMLLQKLNTQDPKYHGQIIEPFFTAQPVRFPDALSAPMRQLLRNDSTERSRIVALLQSLDKAPPELQAFLRAELKRAPHAGPAKQWAILLSRSGTCSPEMVPGLIRALDQEIPSRGGMIGRGSMSYYTPAPANRWTVLQERAEARRALMNLPIDRPHVVPQLMRLLDAHDFETRQVGVAAITRFRSGALIAIPKMLLMEKADNRPRGRIQIVAFQTGLRPHVVYSVCLIIRASLVDLRAGKVAPLLTSTTALLFDSMPRWQLTGRRETK